MKFYITLGVCLSFVLLRSPGMTGVSEDGILALGTAPVIEGNLALAKEKAISCALSKGVEAYLVTRLGSDTMINNFERLVQNVLPHARDGIENFHILTADQTGTEYHILVRLRINRKVMDEKLRQAGLVKRKGQAIKVLFMVSDTLGGRLNYWWRYSDEPAAMSHVDVGLYNSFQERGFRPVNRSITIPETELTAAMRSPDLTAGSAAAWGRLFGVEAVIYGRTEVMDNQKIFLSLNTVFVPTGMTIFQGERSVPVKKDPEGKPLISQALTDLIHNLVSKMAPFIIEAAESGQEQIQQVPLILSGLQTYREFLKFKAFLTQYVLGVKSAKQTRVSKDAISMTIGFEGNGKTLLERIVGHERLPFLMDGRITEDGKILIEIK